MMSRPDGAVKCEKIDCMFINDLDMTCLFLSKEDAEIYSIPKDCKLKESEAGDE